jgi:hypothetical protein
MPKLKTTYLDRREHGHIGGTATIIDRSTMSPKSEFERMDAILGKLLKSIGKEIKKARRDLARGEK